MSRNSSISVVLVGRAARAIEATAPSGSALLGELVLRDWDRDLARLRIEPVGKREHAAVDQAAQDGHDRQKSKQARHVATRARAPNATRITGGIGTPVQIGMKGWRNYDHVPVSVARALRVVSLRRLWNRALGSIG